MLIKFPVLKKKKKKKEEFEDSKGSGSEESGDSDREYAYYSCEAVPKKVRRSVLTSKINSPLYEIEYIWIARKALEVIDLLVGKGHSNLCEGN